jgi:hypothetical protein
MMSAFGIEHGLIRKSRDYKRDMRGRFATTGSNCKTPDSMFHITVKPRKVIADVDLPRDFDLTEKQAIQLENAVHDAMERALAPLFARS